MYGDQIAGIITGMLLDESAVDPKELLSNNAFFVSKVNEAHAIYMNHLKQQQQQWSGSMWDLRNSLTKATHLEMQADLPLVSN